MALRSELLIENLQATRDEPLSNKLRPSTFKGFVGQVATIKVVSAMISGAAREHRAVDHILLYGQPGLGKTTIAKIVGGSTATIKTGGSMRTPKDIWGLLNLLPSLSKHTLIIDEIHSMGRTAQEEIYNLLEDGIMHDRGSNNKRVYSNLTIIATTTDKGKLPAPLIDRFGYAGWLQPYGTEEIAEILKRSASILQLSFNPGSLRQYTIDVVAERSRGVPRIANKIMKRISEFAKPVTKVSLEKALSALGIDELGGTEIERNLLFGMWEKFDGGPVGLTTLCLSSGIAEQDFRITIEPFLVSKGLIQLTAKGRVLTQNGKMYLAQHV